MVLLKKQITYRNKPYEVRWEEYFDDNYYDYCGLGDKIIELVLYEIIEKKILWFKYKDYKKVYSLNVTDKYCDSDYIEQINKLFKVYEIILYKEKEETQRLSNLEQWDGVIK